MPIKEMNLDQIQSRCAEIADLLKAEGADTDALSQELDQLEARKKELQNEAASRRAEAEAVASGEGSILISRKGENDMPIEVRKSAEYAEAYKKYIITGSDKECRALLTENVEGGTVPVPEVALQEIKTAWDDEPIMRRVSKSYLKGNIKIGFEISATDAAVHAEGADAPAEETLTLGIVTMVPKTIKKWINISDEIIDANGEAFVSYVYRELAHKIFKKAADEVVRLILASPAASSATAPGVPAVSGDASQGTIIDAVATLSDEAYAPVAIMNKLTWAAFRKVTTADGYLIKDPFDGLDVLWNNTLPAYATATTGQNFAIVGDLENGFRANFPVGEDIQFKYDDLSLAENDLVKIVGRLPVALSVIAPNHFVKVQKAGT